MSSTRIDLLFLPQMRIRPIQLDLLAGMWVSNARIWLISRRSIASPAWDVDQGKLAWPKTCWVSKPRTFAKQESRILSCLRCGYDPKNLISAFEMKKWKKKNSSRKFMWLILIWISRRLWDRDTRVGKAGEHELILLEIWSCLKCGSHCDSWIWSCELEKQEFNRKKEGMDL